MADTDYIVRGDGAVTTVGILQSTIAPLDNIITMSSIRESVPDSITIGMAVMVGNEIMRIDSRIDFEFHVARGCADTVPAVHLAGVPVWFIGMDVGTDHREYSSGETVGVKILPFTPNNKPLPIASVPPRTLTFNNRFFKPYPPGNFRVNGTPWCDAPYKFFMPADTEMVFSWAHRDRLLQADQLISHLDASIGPETGTTYSVRVYDHIGDLKRTVLAITGTSWSYSKATAVSDLSAGYGSVVICSTRDSYDSLQSYTTLIDIFQSGLGDALGERLGGF